MQQAEYKESKRERKPKKSRKSSKKRMSKGSRVLLTIVCVVVGIALLLGLTVLVLDRIGHSALTSDGSGIRTPDDAEQLEAGQVRYKGQLYKYKKDITAILLMGVDSKAKSAASGEFGGSNQADAIVLAVLDPSTKRITLISVSRDSMCEIEILDDNGDSVGTSFAQIALSYAYGDGGDISCQLTSDAVSKLMYDLPISAYASVYMDGIGKLTDLVGGITVTPNETFGPFTAGQAVTINSSNAELYLRHRDKTVEGNNGRMERHKAVVVELAKAMLRRVRSNPSAVLELYNGVSNNVTTNINTSSMVYLARVASRMTLDTDVHKVAGESVLGEDNHAEFNVDETALYELILEIFYEPIEG